MGDAFVKTCDPYLAAVYIGGCFEGGQDPTCLSFSSPLPCAERAGELCISLDISNAFCTSHN